MFLGAANHDPAAGPHSSTPTRTPSASPATPPDTSASAWAYVARLEAEAVITALARRAARLELTGTPCHHHNNTLRGWGPRPVRVHHA